jgi:iron complex outermembrane receptor protein
VRDVGELPDPAQDAYYELSARLAWAASPSLEFSLSGFNLLDRRHHEYPAPTANAVLRSVVAEVHWKADRRRKE